MEAVDFESGQLVHGVDSDGEVLKLSFTQVESL